MKSAYELAMERLEKSKPSAQLSEAQKAEIAEIESIFKAKIAERELLLEREMGKVRTSGDYGELETLQKQLTSERKRLLEDAEAKKEKIRHQER